MTATKAQIDRRIKALQKGKRTRPDHDLLYATRQVALEEIRWVLYGEVPPD